MWQYLQRRMRLALLLGAGFLIVCLLSPLLYLPNPKKYEQPRLAPDVLAQLEQFYWVWDSPERRRDIVDYMRRQNPEWDLISRCFYGYSLANAALHDPAEKDRALKHLDSLIEDTLQVPWEAFLLPYGHAKPFVHQPASSLMVDGEVSLMIGMRRLVGELPPGEVRRQHAELVRRCVESIEAAPHLTGESYPDECWLWCNPLALLSIQVSDVLEGTDHRDLFRRWEQSARQHMIDPKTGLFYSAVTLDGRVLHAPEGSTIWIGASCLRTVTPALAREQYDRMKQLLAGRLICFAYGREWPRGTRGDWDIDSGFTPFGMGPASTGFALVASKEMEDRDFFRRILGFLELVGVPRTKDGRQRYLSSNFVGDATFLLAKTTGPVQREFSRRLAERKILP